MRISQFSVLAGLALTTTAQELYECGNDPSAEEILLAEAAYRNASASLRRLKAAACNGRHPADTTDPDDGYISPEIIDHQLAMVNTDFAPTGLSFALARAPRYVVNETWFADTALFGSPALDAEMKAALRVGGAQALNVYTLGFRTVASGVAGYATFPVNYTAFPELDGVVLNVLAVPPLTTTRTGTTMSHEVGHWTGLYHTFQGGCAPPGDMVDDTAPQASSTWTCSAANPLDSCPDDAFPDPYLNLMGYAACRGEITPGQIQRMREQMGTFRSVLF
ncbi:Metalloprotease [Mycena kentingensis (nom. inval.)]|nr:Metalloprotease [Mycena kentingensis (nom. inval.)]